MQNSVYHPGSSKFIIFNTQDVLSLSNAVNTLKHTNHRPSVAHSRVLQNAQRNCQLDIVSIDRDIRFLQIKMNKLLLKFQSLNSDKLKRRAESELYTALTSPIRLLPDDVLIRVFVYCLPERPGPITTEAPLLLRLVCSLWKNIAFGASQLWDVLYINDVWDTRSPLHFQRRWFNNAGGRPLAFHYSKPPPSLSSPDSPLVTHKLDHLVPYSN